MNRGRAVILHGHGHGLRWGLLCLVAACGDAGDPDPGSHGGPDSGPGPEDLPPPTSCELSSELGAATAECYLVTVPLDWTRQDGFPSDRSALGGPSIDLFVKRVPAEGTAQAQLWLLQGGPGASSRPLELGMSALRVHHPHIELVTLDHRGVDRSAGLQCPTAAPEGVIDVDNAVACAAEVERQHGEGSLDHFTVTQAAYDLDYVMALLRPDDAPVTVWAFSYGTFWALRYMSVSQTPLAGVVLEASLPGPETDFPNVLGTEEALLQMFDLCELDDFCHSKLPDTREALAFLKAHWGVDHCLSLAEAAAGEGPLGWPQMKQLALDLSVNRFSQVLVAPLVYRMQRCSDADQTVLRTAARRLGVRAVASAGEGGFSEPLHTHIVVSELFVRGDGSVGDIAQWESEMLISPPARAHYASLYDVWPRSPEPAITSWPEPSYPVLMLHGALDAATPADDARRGAENLSTASWVEIPWATHELLINSPAATGSGHCAYDLVSGFLADPQAPLPLDCLDAMLPYNWQEQYRSGIELVSFASMEVFGVADPWEGEP